MATALTHQLLPAAGHPKPPVPPKPPLNSKDGERGSKKRKLSAPSDKPPPPPPKEPQQRNQALVLAQAQAAVATPSTSGAADPQPSSSGVGNPPVGPKATPGGSGTKVKRSQSDVPKKGYVLKPLRQHHSFREAKERKASQDASSSKFNWFCLPLQSFVVKTKAGGAALVEKGSKRLFGKGPRPKKVKGPAPLPPESPTNEEPIPVPSRPKLPPRPVLKRILAGIDNGQAGVWHKLENVKYIDEEVSTEDSTDYTDVDWGQAIHSEPGEETMFYYTYIEEAPNEKVVFYRHVSRGDVGSSTEEETEESEGTRPTSPHMASMENMEIIMPEMEVAKNGVLGEGSSIEPLSMVVEEEMVKSDSFMYSGDEISRSPVASDQPEVHVDSDAELERLELEIIEASVVDEQPLTTSSPIPKESTVSHYLATITEDGERDSDGWPEQSLPPPPRPSSPKPVLPRPTSPESGSQVTPTKVLGPPPPRPSSPKPVLPRPTSPESGSQVTPTKTLGPPPPRPPPLRPVTPLSSPEEDSPEGALIGSDDDVASPSPSPVRSPPPRPPPFRRTPETQESNVQQEVDDSMKEVPVEPEEPASEVVITDIPLTSSDDFPTETSVRDDETGIDSISESPVPPTKKVPEYASVQKISPPHQESTSVPSSPQIIEPYYDLDVVSPPTPKPKIKPKRPPPPVKLSPPSVPPKTYMNIKFPPERLEEPVEVQEDVVVHVHKEDVVQLKSDVMQNGVESQEINDESEACAESPRPESAISDAKPIDPELRSIGSSPIAAGSSAGTSERQLNTIFDVSGEKSISIPPSVTSESGFLSSPTPPPRHRKKRFRSVDGPTRIAGLDSESPVRRSKSCSDADSSHHQASRPASNASLRTSTLTRDVSTNTTPQRPPRPAVKPKPSRPAKPGPSTLVQLAKSKPIDVKSSADSDAVSIVSSIDGSPLLVRMKSRPLPPPPAPPRHRHGSRGTADKTQTPSPGPVASNFPLEFLSKLAEIEAGRLNLTEINVDRIKVNEIEACTIHAGTLHVGVITPLALIGQQSREGGGDNDGTGGEKQDSEKKEEKGDGDNKTTDDGEREKTDDAGGGGGSYMPFDQEREIQPEDSLKLTSDRTSFRPPDSPAASSDGEQHSKSHTKPRVIDRLIVSPVPVPGGMGSSVFYLEPAQNLPKTTQSPTLSRKSASSGSSGKSGKREQVSWYDEGVVPGQSGDIDTSDGRAEGGLESPLPVTLRQDVDAPPGQSDSDAEGTTQVRKQIASLFSFGSGRPSDRKKTTRTTRGSLQLYREESPTSSSTTDAEADESAAVKQHHRHQQRTRSMSAGQTQSPQPEPQEWPQLDPNANYCEPFPPPPGDGSCTGDGRCGTPDAATSSGKTSEPTGTMRELLPAEDDPALPPNGSETVNANKRLSLLSIATSEDSWYNCMSGDDSDTEGTFLTAASCPDDSSISSGATEHRRTKKYYIAHELMTSEQVFVDALKLLNQDFREAVVKANAKSDQKVIPKSTLDHVLSYLPQLQNLNEDLLKDLTERIKNWDENGQIADVITKKGPFLKLYSAYIKDFEMLTGVLDDACRKYPAFAQVVKAFEMSDRCQNLALKHYMLKPVQRIPQYRLLLQDYLKHLTVGTTEHDETMAALKIVSEVAQHANQTMKQGDNFAKLLQLQNSISGGYEIIRPGRLFLKEGELNKLSRKVMQPRWFILFNDTLLHTDVVQQGSYRLHHELPLSGMRVTVPTNEEYQNEFSVISSARSFTLSASSPEERDEWISALNNAIKANALRRGTFATAIDRQKAQSDDLVSSWDLGKQAPVWIPDSRVTMCQLCTTIFTVTFRRHHCRACGKVVCSPCSSNRAPLQYLKFQSVRVCDQCYFKLAEAFDNDDNTASASDCSTECSTLSESHEGLSDSGVAHAQQQSSLDRANLRAQFKRYAAGNGKKAERRLPRVLKEVTANHEGAAISGYLHKRVKKTWRKLWFVINDKVLYSYKASEDVAALESIPLLGFQLQPCSEPFENVNPNLGFQLYHPNHLPLMFYAENAASAERWKKAMQSATILE